MSHDGGRVSKTEAAEVLAWAEDVRGQRAELGINVEVPDRFTHKLYSVMQRAADDPAKLTVADIEEARTVLITEALPWVDRQGASEAYKPLFARTFAYLDRLQASRPEPPDPNLLALLAGLKSLEDVAETLDGRYPDVNKVMGNLMAATGLIEVIVRQSG